jgi:hypothetical protein
MNSFPPVLTKKDFVRRYAAGEFGNASPTWNTIEEFNRSGYTGLVHLRNRVAGGPTWYDTKAGHVDGLFHSLTYGAEPLVKPEDIYFSGMAPTAATQIQGEVMQSPAGLYLYYTRVAKPMRDALREHSAEAVGIMAAHLLRHYLCPNSLEWMHTLLDRYPYHVVEFSTYSTKWGTLAPKFNTVFWEVRAY